MKTVFDPTNPAPLMNDVIGLESNFKKEMINRCFMHMPNRCEPNGKIYY